MEVVVWLARNQLYSNVRIIFLTNITYAVSNYLRAFNGIENDTSIQTHFFDVTNLTNLSIALSQQKKHTKGSKFSFLLIMYIDCAVSGKLIIRFCCI